jgi:MFS family permease
MWFAMFVIAVGFGMVVPILPVFARDLGASGLWLGLAFSGFAVTQTPLTPVMGRLGDRWGRRPFIVAGLGIYVFVGIGLALADTFQAVAALRMVMGVGGACMFTSALATIGELAPRGREGRYMGLFMVSFTSGFGIGPLIGGILKDSVGVDAAFLTLAGAAVFALLLVVALMPSQSATRRTDEELAAIAPVRDMFRDFRVLALFAFNFTFGLGIGAVMTFIAIFMNDVLLASATMVGLVVGSRAVLSSVFQPIFGRLADRVPRQHMVAISGVLLAAATAAIPLSPTVTALLVVFLLLGLAESAAMPASMAITTDLGRVYGYGTLMGVTNAILVFGLLAGSLGSSVVETQWGVDNVFRAAALIMGLLVVVFLGIWSRAPRLQVQPSVVD